MDNFVITGHGVDGYMDFDSMLVSELHCPGQLLRGEISREGAHTKAGTCQIDGISAVKYSHVKPFHIACRA